MKIEIEFKGLNRKETKEKYDIHITNAEGVVETVRMNYYLNPHIKHQGGKPVSLAFSGLIKYTDEEIVEIISYVEYLFNERLIFENSKYDILGFKGNTDNPERSMNNGERRYYKVTGRDYIERK